MVAHKSLYLKCLWFAFLNLLNFNLNEGFSNNVFSDVYNQNIKMLKNVCIMANSQAPAESPQIINSFISPGLHLFQSSALYDGLNTLNPDLSCFLNLLKYLNYSLRFW